MKNNLKQYITKPHVVCIILILLVIVWMIEAVLKNSWHNVFMCIFTLGFFLLPTLIERIFKVKFSPLLEILTYLFIFCSQILGEVKCFYLLFPHWDTMLHFLNGILMGGIGFSLIELLNKNKIMNLKLSSLFISTFIFCFSLTIGVFGEISEFSLDQTLDKDCQKDYIVKKISSVKLNKDKNNKPIILKNITKTKIYSDKNKVTTIKGYLDIGIKDTMKDLIADSIGALVFTILGYLYLKDSNKYKFIEELMIKEK